MRYVVHVAPDDIRRMSLVLGDTLHIWVGAQLDEMSRERYIQAKLDLYRIKRRRGLIAFLPVGGSHAAGQSKVAATTTAVGSGVIAATVVASGILSGVFDDSHTPARNRPPAAAPAPTRPGLSKPARPPVSSPPEAPSRPKTSRPATPSNLPVQVDLPVHADPVPATVPGVPRLPGLHPPRLRLPAPPPVVLPPPKTRGPSPLLTVSRPQAGAQVRVSTGLSVRAHLGSLRARLGQQQP